MIDYLEQAPWYLSSFIVATIALLFAILALGAVRIFTDTRRFKDHHDVAGFTLGIIGVMYAVLLSYTVVDVHERYNAIHQNVDTEANLAAELYRDAEVFPENVRNEIKTYIRQYLAATIENGFEIDPDGEMDAKIDDIITKLWSVYYAFEPNTNREKVWYAESVKRLNEFNRTRLLRLFNNNDSIGVMMWTMLIAGAFITVSFMYLFRVENVVFHGIMIGMLTVFIALMLFLVQSLDTAFSGDIHISPVHFEEVLKLLESRN